MSTIISAEQIIGRDLFAIKKVNVIDISSNIVYSVNAGDRVGTVFSYLERNGSIWWQLEDNNYVIHEHGLFDLDAIIAQGGKTSEQQQEDERRKNLNFFEKLADSVGSTFNSQKKAAQIGLTLIIATIVILTIIKITQVSKIKLNPA